MYSIRPVTFGDMGVYKMIDATHAEIVFQGTYQECLEYIRNHK